MNRSSSGHPDERLSPRIAARRLAAGFGLDIRGELRKPFGAGELEEALRSLR
jgi:hypothetical protein